MEQAKYVVGVDVGTGSARAGVFAASDGTRTGMATQPIRMWRPHPDFVEQSSGDIWEAVGACVRDAVAQSGIDPGAVVGIGWDATCSLVALGEEDAPVTVSPTGNDAQNVIVWMDHRATAEADAINRQGYDILKQVGGTVSPEMEPPKLKWLKAHLPQSWARTRKFFDLTDFLTYAATGRDVRSLCTNVCKWLYIGHEDRWDRAFYEAEGIGDIFDGRVGEATIRPPGERIGSLTPAAARHLGLSTSCQAGVGAIDAHAGGIGLLGAALGGAADAATGGERLETVVALIGGTSSCHMAASRRPIFVPGVWGPYYGAMVPGLWLTEGGQSAAGSLIDGAIETHPAYPVIRAEAEAAGETVYQTLNRRVAQKAEAQDLADTALLTRDLHVLDYHLGNRSPHADPHARGVVDGLPLHTSPDSLALLYLATVQAVAYGTRAIVEAMNAQGFRIDTILAAGGGTKNPLWLRQHADATGLAVVLGGESESVLLGAAILGAVAGGAHPSVTAAMRAMSRAGETTPPNPAVRRYHEAKFAVYQDLYTLQTANRARMRQADNYGN
ncbi:MAG: FGGY-family carbohydrate kinase [Cytophagales bacterium]|nr:FGGY-family carbohydrate kinase [Armatimonadota bacterium]